MKTLFNRNYRTVIAALAAVAIVGLCGLTLERGHMGALPAGVVEIGELETLAVGGLNVAVLPAIEVIGDREVHLADIESADAGHQG